MRRGQGLGPTDLEDSDIFHLAWRIYPGLRRYIYNIIYIVSSLWHGFMKNTLLYGCTLLILQACEIQAARSVPPHQCCGSNISLQSQCHGYLIIFQDAPLLTSEFTVVLGITNYDSVNIAYIHLQSSVHLPSVTIYVLPCRCLKFTVCFGTKAKSM